MNYKLSSKYLSQFLVIIIRQKDMSMRKLTDKESGRAFVVVGICAP